MNAFKELAPVIYGETGIKFHNYTIGANNLCFPAHWHERAELLKVISGRLQVFLDKEAITATAGQTVLIMPDMIHCGFAGDEGVEYNMIAFDGNRFFNGTDASDKYLVPFFRHELSFCPIIDHPEVVPTLEALEQMLTGLTDAHPLTAVGKLYELIGLLCRYCTMDACPIHRPDERFGCVLEYMNNHYTEDISARDISHRFGYEETYFCRRFKEATGITAMKYIRVLRLELAQKLLRTSSDDIRSIAWQCGFSDICYFSNCFKQHFGQTPTEYRRSFHP